MDAYDDKGRKRGNSEKSGKKESNRLSGQSPVLPQMLKSDGSEEQKVAKEDQKRTLVDTKKKASSSKNSPKVHVSKRKSLTKEIKPKAQLAVASSRSALMLSLALKGQFLKTTQTLEDGKSCKHSNQKTHDKHSNQPPQLMPASSRRNLCAVKKHIALKEKSLINELEPGHIGYLSLDAVGSGSYGEYYHAHYRGINIVVKKMIHRDTEEDKLRARHEVVPETHKGLIRVTLICLLCPMFVIIHFRKYHIWNEKKR